MVSYLSDVPSTDIPWSAYLPQSHRCFHLFAVFPRCYTSSPRPKLTSPSLASHQSGSTVYFFSRTSPILPVTVKTVISSAKPKISKPLSLTGHPVVCRVHWNPRHVLVRSPLMPSVLHLLLLFAGLAIPPIIPFGLRCLSLSFWFHLFDGS